MTRIAAIDVGSLTVRLAVAEVEGAGRFRVVCRRRAITRLGEGVATAGRLSPAAVARTLTALAGFGRELAAREVVRTRGVATQAVRQAADGGEFLAQAGAALGVPVAVISPEEEAHLTLQGVLSALEPGILASGPVVLFDLGGGSTEFVLLIPGHAPVFAGLPLGVVSLTEAYPLGDPPEADRLAGLQEVVARQLEIFYKNNFMARLASPPTLVGTAGAVTTLAAMAQELRVYEAARVNNYRLTKVRLKELARLIYCLPGERRALLPGLEPAKAAVMVAGVLVVLEILATFSQDALIAVDAGLLEGMLAGLAA